MESTCKKYWQAGLPCPTGLRVSALTDSSGQATIAQEHTSSRGIAFGADPQTHGALGKSVPVPGYDAPGLPLKPSRDPSLSLIALSGIEPSGPVMVEVPLVQNNTTFTAASALQGRRLGFAERFVEGHEHQLIEHRISFLKALDILRRSGAVLVPVHAHRTDTPHVRNEIDELVHEYRLDALVSDSRSIAFHGACWSGYPGLGEPLEDGATLWFYGARWAKEWLVAMVCEYRSSRRLMDPLEGYPLR